MARLIKAILTILVLMVAFDIAGAVGCFIFEVLGFEFKTLFFTVWFVAGAFCGFVAYDRAGKALWLGTADQGDWSNTAESGRLGLTVIAITVPILLVLSVLFNRLFWQAVSMDGRYVPDNMIMSLTYFVTILGAMVLGHFAFRPGASKRA